MRAEYARPELNRPTPERNQLFLSLYGLQWAYTANLAKPITLRDMETNLAEYAWAYTAKLSVYG